jgi:hypothetical protein
MQSPSNRVIDIERSRRAVAEVLEEWEREHRWGKVELGLQDGIVETVRIERLLKVRELKRAA